MRRRRTTRVPPLALLLVLVAASAVSLWQARGAPNAAPRGTYPPPPSGLTDALVTGVTDGDTITVRLPAGAVRLRLIGVDTPESRPGDRLDLQVREQGRSREAILAMGREATAFTAGRLADREVRLEYDVQRHDRFGRLLAYLWLPDGTLFNGELLWAGYAQVLTIPPNVRYADLFLRLQHEAREARRGFWGR